MLSTLHWSIVGLSLLNTVLGVASTCLLFSRSRSLGGLPPRIYLLNMAYMTLCVTFVSLTVNEANVTLSWWCLVGAIIAGALTGAQLASERWRTAKATW